MSFDRLLVESRAKNIILPLADYKPSIGAIKFTTAILFSLFPLSLKYISITVVVLALPVHQIPLELPHIHILVWKFQSAKTMFITFVPLSLILGSRHKCVLAITMDVILDEHAVI